MTAARIVSLLIILSCLMVGYLAASGSDERLAMLIRDGRRGEASLEIDKMVSLGHTSAQLLTSWARVEESTGGYARAAQFVEAYLSRRPADVETLTWLLSLYERVEDTDGQIDTLDRLLSLDPRVDRVNRLLALYRYYGRFKEERRLLERFAGGTALADGQITRLAEMLIADGDPSKAARLIRAQEASKRATDRQRVLLFDALIRTQQYAEAAERARAWLAGWGRPWMAAQMIVRLAEEAPTDIAAKFAMDSAERSTDAKVYLVGRLLAQGNVELGRLLFRQWAHEAEPLSAEDAGRYVAGAAALGLTVDLWQVFFDLATQSRRTDAAALAEAIADQFGMASLEPALPSLIGVASTRPLLAARLAIHEGRPGLAAGLLYRLDQTGMSVTEQRRLLLLLLELHGAAGMRIWLDQQPGGSTARPSAASQSVTDTPDNTDGAIDQRPTVDRRGVPRQ
jgi:hypothetical protein